MLMKLRNVPADELAEIHALMEEHDIVVYETAAGMLGISLPALWLRDEIQLDQARTLLDAYQEERYARARRDYEALKEAGRTRTLADMARENPLRFIVYIALAAAVAWISTAPFF